MDWSKFKPEGQTVTDWSKFSPEVIEPDRSKLRAVGDTAVQFGKGAVTGVKMLTDVFGADNRASGGLQSATDALDGLLSATAKKDQARVAEIMQEAEGKGWMDQIAIGLRAAGVAPAALMAQAAGTMLPTIAAAAIPGGQGILASRLGMAGVGAAQGVGATKGAIFDETKNRLQSDGMQEADARTLATDAQSYGGDNTGQIALGGALGILAGSTGAERAVSALRSGISKSPASFVGRVAQGGAVEAIPEALQGGQEKYATNTALKNLGYNVDPMSGVVAGATMEGLAGFGMGAGFGAISKARNPIAEIGAATSVDEAIGKAPVIADIAKAGSADQAIAAFTSSFEAGDSVRQQQSAQAFGAEKGILSGLPSIASLPPVGTADKAELDALIASETADVNARRQGILQSAEADLNSLVTSESRDLQVMRANMQREQQKQQELDQPQTTGRAVAGASSVTAPNAMQLAMEKARLKAAQPAPEVEAPAVVQPALQPISKVESPAQEVAAPQIQPPVTDIKSPDLVSPEPVAPANQPEAAPEAKPIEKPSARQVALDSERARIEAKRSEKKAAKSEASSAPAGLSVGLMPNSAEPVTVKDSVVYVGKYAATNFESGDDVTVPADASPAQIAEALRTSGALGKRARVFGLTEKPEASAAAPTEAKPVDERLIPKSKRENSEHIGRDNIPLKDGGKPFKLNAEAKKAKKKQPMLRVMKVKGGYVLVPKTERQIAAQEKAAKRLVSTTPGEKGVPTAAHQFIASMGGLAQSTRADMGVEKNPRVGSKFLFAGLGRGLSIEKAAEALKEAGYLKASDSHQEARDLIKRSLTQPQYTAEGFEQMAEADQNMRFEDQLAAQEESAQNEDYDPFESLVDDGIDPFDIDSSGYDEAADPIKLIVNALVAQAKDMGLDVDYLQEQAFENNRNGSEQDYLEAARDAIQSAIDASQGNRSEDSGQASDAPSEAVDLFGAAPSDEAQAQARADAEAAEASKKREAAALEAKAKRDSNKAEKDRRAAEIIAEDKARRDAEIAALQNPENFNFGGDAPAAPAPVIKKVTTEQAIGQRQIGEEERKAPFSDDFMDEVSKGIVADGNDAFQEGKPRTPPPNIKSNATTALWLRGWDEAKGEKPAQPVAKATEILDAANVTGKERIDALKDVKKGDITPDELQAAYPAKEAAKPAAKPDDSVKPEAGTPVDQANAIEPMAADEVEDVPDADIDNDQKEKIGDFGRKVMVRKDEAQPTGLKMAKSTDERPAWARPYVVMQATGGRSAGKWRVMKLPKGKKSGAVMTTGSAVFDTEQEALNMIPMVEVARNHRAYPEKMDATSKWGIYRLLAEGKKRALVKGGFASSDEAMTYMAKNPIEIIEHKFKFPERPWLDKIERTGASRRTKNVTKAMFEQTFAPGGVVYGNWLLNKDDTVNDDGQELSNQAFDALMDLAETLGVPPKALFLNGDMVLGLGADGKGGINSGAAHYSPSKGLINLTKINGAGSLAHEWWHSVDHYFAKSSGWKDSDSVVSAGFNVNRTAARPELMAAIKKVIDAINYTAKSTTTDADMVRANAQSRIEKSIKSLDYKISQLRMYLVKPWKAGKKPATTEQLAKFDALTDKLREGDQGEKVYIEPSAQALLRSRLALGYQIGANIRDMNAIYKSVVGSSFLKSDPQSEGRQLVWPVEAIKDNKEKLETKDDVTVEHKGRTDFYIEARDIDSHRASSYWSTPHEMGARAFESYIFDKLTEGKQQSDYLVYAVENRYYAGLDMKPYPEGSERKAINNSFDELFKAIQTKETEQGVAMFSRSQPDQTDTPQFKTFFGDSVVTDTGKAGGKPLVVYHGTGQGGFNIFDRKSWKTAYGHFFTPDKSAADYYDHGKQSQTYEVYLKAENPLRLDLIASEEASTPKWLRSWVDENFDQEYGDAQEQFTNWLGSGDLYNLNMGKQQDDLIATAEDNGHDGVFFFDAKGGGGTALSYVVFEPTQIKSATGNNGQFDPANPDIRFSRSQPFYSALTKEVGNINANAQSAMGWMANLRGLVSNGKVKADELEWSGVTDWLKLQDGKVSKEQVVAFLSDKAIRTEGLVRYAAGSAAEQVATELGVGATTVGRWIAWAGIGRTSAETKGVTPEKRAQALRLYKDGDSIESVSKATGLGTSTIHRLLVADGSNRSLENVRNADEDTKNDAISLYILGLNTYEAAEQTGVSQTTVAGWVRQSGVSRGYSDAQALRVVLGRNENNRGIKAKFTSIKGGGTMHAASIYELARMHQLEIDQEVTSFERTTDRIPYGDGKTYVPDLTVTRSDGTTVVEEIKPEPMLEKEDVRQKAEAARIFYRDSGKQYRLITERHIGQTGFDLIKPEDYPAEIKRIKPALATARWAAREIGAAIPDITPALRDKAVVGLPMFSKGTGTQQQFQPLANQSTAKALNATLVNYGLGQDWSSAYEAVKLPDALSGVRAAIQTAFGRDVRPVAPTAAKFNIFNGVYIPSQPNAVYVNVASDVGFVNIAGHELWHVIKRQRPDLVEWYQTNSRQFYKDLPAYQTRLNALLQPREKAYDLNKAEEELEADFLGDSLADPEFLQQLADASPSKFKELLNRVRMWLGGVLSKLKGLGSSKEVSDVKALQAYLKDVLVAFAEGKDIPATPRSIDPAFARGTSEAVTNSNNVVGNQGGRSADDSTPGDPKPLTEKQFYSQYAQHIDIRGRDGTAEATKGAILRDGFKKGINVNAMPPYRGGNPTNVMDAKFAPRKGDIVYLAPKSAWLDKPNGIEIQDGWRPKPYEVIVASEDRLSMYQEYLRAFNEPSAPDSGGAPAFSRSIKDTLNTAANNPRGVVNATVEHLNDRFNAPGTLNWWQKSIGTQYDLAQRSAPFKKVFDSVQNFINDTSFYATEAADLAPKLIPKLETWKDIGKKSISAQDSKAIAAPIFEGTLIWKRLANGQLSKTIGDEQGGVVFTADELKQRFGLTESQIALYKEFRTATDKSLTNLVVSHMVKLGGADVAPIADQALQSKNAKEASDLLSDYLVSLAEQDENRSDVLMGTAAKMTELADKANSLTSKGYAPLSRFGSYTVDVISEGKRVYFGMFESKFEANQMTKRMQGNYPDSSIRQGTVSQEEYKLFAGVTPETLELFGEMLGLDSQGGDAKNQVFQEYLKAAKSNRSAMKRLIHRKGIEGFSEDASRVLAGFIYSNARQTSANLHAGQITKATSEIPQGQGEVKDAAIKLATYVQNPQEEAQALRGLMFAQYIGGSVASAMVNLTQPFTMTLPWLSQYGGIVKAGKQMVSATRDALKAKTGDPELDAALKVAEEQGIVSPQEVHQLQQQASGAGVLKSGDGTKAGDAKAAVSNAASRIMLGWGKLFGVAEQFNRRSTFIAAYRTAVEQSIENPVQFAEKAIAETQGIYNKGNKPAWARGAIGATLFTFKQFSISYVEMIGRMATGPNANTESRMAALNALAILVLVSGIGGFPGADDLDDVISGLMQSMGYNFDSKAKRRAFLVEYLGAGGQQFVQHGFSGLPGVPVDVSGRLGMGNLIPGTGLFTKKNDHTRDVAEFAGPAGDLFKRGFDAVGKLLRGDFVGASIDVSPVAARNVVKAFDMANMGMYRDQKGNKVIDTDMVEAVFKGVGFQPNSVKQVQDSTGEAQRMIGLNKIRETEIADKWAQGLFEKDADKTAEARQELMDWNADNPDMRIKIDYSQIFRRLKAMNQNKVQRIEKTAPKEIRSLVRQELMTQ